MSYFIQGPIAKSEYLKANQHCGALIEFSGVVRSDYKNGKTVDYIEYSAYQAMAEKVFEKIKNEVLDKFKIQELIILHSVGHVNVEEVGMWVAVNSKHRREGFEALQYAIDSIKSTVPIWKKEVYTDQSYDWVRCDRCYQHTHPIPELFNVSDAQ